MSRLVKPGFEAQFEGYREAVEASFGRQSLMATMGITISEFGPGWIELRVAAPDGFGQQHGYLHAGVLTSALDSACGYAAMSLMPPQSDVLTVEFKVNFLSPASERHLVALGTVIRPGRRITVSRAEVYPLESDTPIAAMTATLVRARQGVEPA